MDGRVRPSASTAIHGRTEILIVDTNAGRESCAAILERARHLDFDFRFHPENSRVEPPRKSCRCRSSGNAETLGASNSLAVRTTTSSHGSPALSGEAGDSRPHRRCRVWTEGAAALA
jgi:hypothetical protein